MTDNVDRTYGTELEKPFTDLDGNSHSVGREYFESLRAQKTARGEAVELHTIGNLAIGVGTPYGEESLDNGFNLGEGAVGPISQADGGLTRLDEIINQTLIDVEHALGQENAAILNMSNHPLVIRDIATYKRFVAPKPGYDYVRTVRGWHHEAGINASAQNSPSTGVSAYEAADAVTTMIGLGSAMVAFYANSPFQDGRVTGLLESRMGIWEDMFARATKVGDRRLHHAPKVPLETMRDYFEWMFGPGTTMFFVPMLADRDAKVAKGVVNIDGDPSLLEYLAAEEWPGHIYGSGEATVVKPKLSHLALHQFLQFSGARVRFGLKEGQEDSREFTVAMRQSGGEVEDLMAKDCEFVYIEGRDPGANFVDNDLLDRAGDGPISRSVVISPSALQAGLLNNLPAARRLVDSFGWNNLMTLRTMAAKHGMDAVHNGIKQTQVCEAVLQVAADGLELGERAKLAYPEFVLRTGLSGAARALAMYEERPETSEQARIRAVIKQRRAVIHDTIA